MHTALSKSDLQHTIQQCISLHLLKLSVIHWTSVLCDFFHIFSEERINGFQLYGTDGNGSQQLIYNDTATNDRDFIVIDSRYMPAEPINGITIKQNNNFLTLCEVEVYGKWKT